MLIEEATRQGGLGVDLCPSMLVKDRFAVRPHVMLKHAYHLVGRITRSDREAE